MLDFSNVNDFRKVAEKLRQFNPLKASEKPINPYEPCWCGSSKKWKFCHKDREKQNSRSLGELIKSLYVEFQIGTCQHPLASPGTCSSPEAIKSHTVQRRGGLAAVAENGHVYSSKAGFADLGKNVGMVSPKKIGVKAASTFPGFCSYHDSEMFRPVENIDAVLNSMNAFLLSFRAVAYEVSTKAASIINISKIKDVIDGGRSFEEQVQVQTLLHTHEKGLQLGMRDASRWKGEYDKAYLLDELAFFRFYGIAFDTVLPFVAAGAFMPEYDFNGNELQDLNSRNSLEHIALNVTVLGQTTVAILGWIGDENEPAAKLVSQLAAKPQIQKADAILFLAIEYLENIYFKPSWWDGLDPSISSILHEKIGGGIKSRSPSALSEHGCPILTANVVNIFDERKSK